MKSDDTSCRSLGKVAFVAGANGISGQAIIEQLIRADESEWYEAKSQIIITSRSPLKVPYVDHRVRFIALDLLQPKESIIERLRGVCEKVTHAFFTSYVHDNNFNRLHVKNGPLFRNFLEAIDAICLNLERVVLQTGGKHYGIQFREFTTPFWEDMPRYEGPGNIFYYEQEDDLFTIQKRRKAWNYNVIRPMGILGFTAQYSGINEIIPIAQYFLICRELGQHPQWPGTLSGYHRIENKSYAPSIADLTLWAATQDHCKDEAFNHCNGDVVVWKFLWNHLGRYYHVAMDRVREPAIDAIPMDMASWAKDKRPVWEEITAKYGGDPDAFRLDSFALLNWILAPSGGSLYMSTETKARKFGWSRFDDTYEAWLRTLRSYENAGILPPQSCCP